MKKKGMNLDQLLTRLNELANHFGRLADKAPYVEAQFIIKLGKITRFTFKPLAFAPKPDRGMRFLALRAELNSLTEQGGQIGLEMFSDERFSEEKFHHYLLSPFDASRELNSPWEWWFLFLTRLPDVGTYQSCYEIWRNKTKHPLSKVGIPARVGSKGTKYPLSNVNGGAREIHAGISYYPQVCLAAIAWLKAKANRASQKFEDEKEDTGLEVCPGGIKYGKVIVDVSGKPRACIEALLDAQEHRSDWWKLRERVWGENSYTDKKTVINTISDARDKLRELARKSGKYVDGNFDPLPCVDQGKNVAWKLNFPK
jgi:hypothetical protein